MSDFGFDGGDPDRLTVGPYNPAGPANTVDGVSTYRGTDPISANTQGLTGVPWSLPSNFQFPPGLAAQNDGVDVGGNAPPGHTTIYPTTAMTYSQFETMVRALPWQQAGPRIK